MIKILIIDYSQIAMAAILPQIGKTFEKTEQNEGLLRHIILNSIRSYRMKFKKEGEVVIACDGRNYWRKQQYPFYKGTRKKARDASDLDWGFIFDTMAKVKLELKEVFPYKVIDVDTAEADDVIACIVKYKQTNDLVAEGLYTEPTPITIISSDKDFIQLQKYDKVKQFSPMTKKLIKPEISAVEDLLEKVLTGDTGDCVPSVLCEDDYLLKDSSVRERKVLTKKRKDDIKKCIKNNLPLTSELQTNLNRNMNLINFEYIPSDIYNSIVSEYKNQTPTASKNKMFNYFIKNRMPLMADSVEEFV